MPGLRNHSILAKVIKVDRGRVWLDPGYYGINMLERREIRTSQVYNAAGKPVPGQSADTVRPGDYLRVRLGSFFTPYGDMQLEPYSTGPDARHKLVWEELAAAKDSRQPVYGRVLNSCNGGYAVGVSGYVALLPYNKSSLETVQKIGVLQPFYVHSIRGNLLTLSDMKFKPKDTLYSSMYSNI